MSSISSEINRYSRGSSSITANALSARIWWYKHTSNHRTDTNTAGRVLSNSVCKLKNGFSFAKRGWRSSTLPMHKISTYMHIYIYVDYAFCFVKICSLKCDSMWLCWAFDCNRISLLLLLLSSCGSRCCCCWYCRYFHRINEDGYHFLFDGMHSFVFISNCNFITNT